MFSAIPLHLSSCENLLIWFVLLLLEFPHWTTRPDSVKAPSIDESLSSSDDSEATECFMF